MTNETLNNLIQTIESSLVNDTHFLLDKNAIDAFQTLVHSLNEIYDKIDSYSTEDKRTFISQLKPFQINLFRQLIARLEPPISNTLLNSFMDVLLYQIQIEMAIDSNINDSYFDLSLDCLTSDFTINYILELRATNLLDDRLLELYLTIGNRAMWNKIKKCRSISIIRKTTPTFFPSNNKTNRLLRELLNYLDRHFKENPLSNTKIMVFIWIQGMLDIIPFVPYFVNAGYPETVVRWLNVEPSERTISVRAWREILDLIHNLARHPSGVNALNQMKTIPTLKLWKEHYFSDSTVTNDQNYKDMIVLYHMIYALLLEPELLKNEDVTNIQLALDHLLDRIVEAFQSPTLRCGPYNVSEFWHPLAKFTVNDKCLLYMLGRGNTFEYFLQKFLEFNQLIITEKNSESFDLYMLICSLLHTIFWSISFQSKYHSELKNNKEFVSFLQQNCKMETSPNDELLTSIRRSSKGILFNLDLEEQYVPSIRTIEEDPSDSLKVMVSYSHKDDLFCRKLVTHLQDNITGDIWVDFIKLKPPYDDDWELIAHAITNCDVVVMIVTASYCNSKSCRREVIHADKRKKRMIPVYQGKTYKPEDWFEIRVGSATWVRFGHTKSDEETMDTLVKLISSQTKIKSNVTHTVNLEKPSDSHHMEVTTIVKEPSIPSKVSTPKTSVEQWTCEEVQQWLGLSPSVLQFSCGRALITYAKLISDEQAQRDEYERNLRSRNLTREQWANLISSLTDLRVSNTVETSSTTPPTQWSFDEIKCWFEKNNLSHYLLETLSFINGFELVTYARILINGSTRIESEYDRLRIRIKNQHQGQDLLQLDEYVRFVGLLREIVQRSEMLTPSKHNTDTCDQHENLSVIF